MRDCRWSCCRRQRHASDTPAHPATVQERPGCKPQSRLSEAASLELREPGDEFRAEAVVNAAAERHVAAGVIDRAPWPRWPSRIRAARGLTSLAGFVKILSLRPSGGLRTLDACGGSGSRCSATGKCSTSPDRARCSPSPTVFGDARTPGYGVSIVAAKPGPVTTSRELALVVQRRLTGPTGGLDTLLVAGGRGTSAAMRDRRSSRPSGSRRPAAAREYRAQRGRGRRPAVLRVEAIHPPFRRVLRVPPAQYRRQLQGVVRPARRRDIHDKER
jgi:hypothetical protein